MNDNERFNRLDELLGNGINQEESRSEFNDVFNIFSENKPPSNETYIRELNDLLKTYREEKSNEQTNQTLFVNESNLEDDGNFIPDTINTYDNYDNEKYDYNNSFEPVFNNVFVDTVSVPNNNEIKNVTNPYEPVEIKTIFIEPTNVDNEKDNEVINEKIEPSYDMRKNTRKRYNLLDFLANPITLSVLMLLIFIAVLVLAVKAFYFNDVVKKYNGYSKDSDTVIYQNDNIGDEIIKKAAAKTLVDCISTPVDINNMPNDLRAIINEINEYYKKTNNAYAFTYKDIFTGFTVSYNERGNIFAASTIKAPVNIYLYEMAAEGKINLDEQLTYTKNYYNEGTGILKNKSFNTNYSIRELSSYAIRNSDNAAHNMLMDNYGRKNILSFWQNLGTETILTGNNNWGSINAHDAVIYMEELYKFYYENNEYGSELMNNFLNAKTKFIKGKNNYKVANKSGWSGSSQHDVSIIFAENPYILVALSNYGYDNNYMTHFNKVNDLAYNLHTTYWKYKTNMCKNIELYK